MAPAGATSVARHEGRSDVCTFARDASGRIVSPAQITVYEAHQHNDILRKFDRNCNGRLDADEFAAYSASMKRRVQTASNAAYAAAAVPMAEAAKSKAPANDAPAKQAAKPQTPETGCFSLFMRQSYADLNNVSTASCATDLKKVNGALFAWSRDGIAENDQWLAKGVVGARFLKVYPIDPTGNPYLNYIAVAPLMKFQRVANSNKKAAKDIDVFSPGLSAEAFIDQLGPDAQLYVRLRGNANGDFDGNIDSWSGTAEIQPLILNLFGDNHPIPNVGYWALFPLLRTQYFWRANNSSDPLFDTADRVFRAGPAVSLYIWPLDDPSVPAILRSLVFNVNYSWYHDFISGRDFDHFDSVLRFDLTPNFGIAFEYEKGKIEANGQPVDLTTVGATVKF